MCKVMPVILVDRVVNKKIIIGKMECPGVADPPPKKNLFCLNGD
jgi:hypothetical protein